MSGLSTIIEGTRISIDRVDHVHGKYAVDVPAGSAHFRVLEDAIEAFQYACHVARTHPVVLDVPSVEASESEPALLAQ